MLVTLQIIVYKTCVNAHTAVCTYMPTQRHNRQTYTQSCRALTSSQEVQLFHSHVPTCWLKNSAINKLVQINIRIDGYSDKKQLGGKSKPRKTSWRKQFLNCVWTKKLSEIIVCAGISSRFTNKVKPNQAVARTCKGEREEPPLSVLSHKLAKELAFPASAHLGEIQRIIKWNPVAG